MTFASFGVEPVETERERLKREAADRAAKRAGYCAALEDEANGVKGQINLRTYELDVINEQLQTVPDHSRLLMEAERDLIVAAIDRLHGRIALIRGEQELNR